ncbi:hypothetical protein WJX74_004531 [Apatococcus lobatus]|uniref:Uncharacterized protein n=1 Tax=Apatococcus lobatus TaxID=904363 RepID=A0AAW1RJ70_9CHLO
MPAPAFACRRLSHGSLNVSGQSVTGCSCLYSREPNMTKPHISMAGALAIDGNASSQPTSEENMQLQSGGVSHAISSASSAPQHAFTAQPIEAHAPASFEKLAPAPDKQLLKVRHWHGWQEWSDLWPVHVRQG